MDLNLSEGLQIRAFQKYIFNSRKQEDNETIEDFANTLTRLGANIGADEQIIVDRFIAGLKNDSARLGILQAPNEPFNLEMALSIAKNHEHETILYTEQAETISVPVTSMPNSAEGFDGYQVIVMPSHEPILDPKPLVKYPSAPNEGSLHYSRVLLNSYAKKSASLRENRKQLECNQCSFKCLTPMLMSLHYIHHHNQGETNIHKNVSCEECQAKFLTKAAMETHLVMIHNHSKEELTKNRISQVLKTKNEDGQIDNHQSGDMACELCFVKFQTPTELCKHMEQSHHGYQFHMCSQCFFKAPTKSLLLRHIARNHDEGSKRFRCMLCNTAFTTRGSLTTHTKKEHKGHKIFMCDTCGKKFQTHKTLDVHRRVVHEQVKPFSCDQCDYTAGQKASLITHINSVHENNRPYVCELCGYKTASPSTLNAHKRMVHEKQRPFVCETCGRSFAAKAGMENHILLIHDKAMPYACDHCPKRFKRKPDLTNHVKCVHQGNYFVCKFCNNPFQSQRNLDRHVSVVHDQNKPFECGACGLSFARKERLKQHIERTHQNEIIVETETPVIEEIHNLQGQAISSATQFIQIQTHEIQPHH